MPTPPCVPDGVAAHLVRRLAAAEAREIFGDETWPEPRDRLHGVIFMAGLSALVASWLSGEVELSVDELVTTASDSLVALMRRTA